jgi:hypothetical protein
MRDKKTKIPLCGGIFVFIVVLYKLLYKYSLYLRIDSCYDLIA